MIGIGRPLNTKALEAHVLGKFAPTERIRLQEESLPKLTTMITDLIERRKSAALYERSLQQAQSSPAAPKGEK